MGEPLNLINPFERNTVIKKPADSVVGALRDDTRRFLAELPEGQRVEAHRAIFAALTDSALGTSMDRPVEFTDVSFENGQMVEIPRTSTLGKELRRRDLGALGVAEYLDQA